MHNNIELHDLNTSLRLWELLTTARINENITPATMLQSNIASNWIIVARNTSMITWRAPWNEHMFDISLFVWKYSTADQLK
jgi:hypothetical protein